MIAVSNLSVLESLYLVVEAVIHIAYRLLPLIIVLVSILFIWDCGGFGSLHTALKKWLRRNQSTPEEDAKACCARGLKRELNFRG
jgi:hypothetical protein